MCNPIYFPYTCIAVPLLSSLTACFPRVVLYQPRVFQPPPAGAPGGSSDLLEIRLPASGQEDVIEKMCREYRLWLQHNPGWDREMLKAGGAQIPFFDETATSQIVGQLRGGAGRPRPQPTPC